MKLLIKDSQTENKLTGLCVCVCVCVCVRAHAHAGSGREIRRSMGLTYTHFCI